MRIVMAASYVVAAVMAAVKAHAAALTYNVDHNSGALSPHISQVSRCGGWVRAGGWFRTWPARVPAAVGGWAGSTMVSLVAGLVESRSQAAAALRNRA